MFKTKYPVLHIFLRYLLALGILGLAVAFRIFVFPIESDYQYLTVYPAMIVVFMICGFGPGILVTLLSSIMTLYYFERPSFLFELNQYALVALLIYLLSSLILGIIINKSQNIAKKLQTENEKLSLTSSIFSRVREGIMITEADGKIVDVNEAFTSITGYSRIEVLGQSPRILSSGYHKKEFFDILWHDLLSTGHWYGEIWNRRKNGEIYASMQNIELLSDAEGNIKNFVALISDITIFKEHEKELEYIAHYDTLTNLPNRVLMSDRLQQAMVHSQRHSKPMAVAFLDLDGFKAVNDQYGHEAGDKLLVTISGFMREVLREGDTLSRLGGDEFVIILPDLMDIETTEPMLQRLLAAAARPITIDNFIVNVSASLGVSFYPQTEEINAEQILRQADQAMYQAKMAGKNRFHVFDIEQDKSTRIYHESLERIDQALTNNEFVLYYQPKVNMRTGAVVGAEALIRWQHPEKGLLLPEIFLPLIENHLLNVKIGEWVIDNVLAQIELWSAIGLNVSVSVNISSRQLMGVDFVERLRTLFAAHPNVSPSNLELEMLETSVLSDLVRASAIIRNCKEFGVSFALDDFGTGYSSLTYLKYLPVSTIKIDQSFIRNMLTDMDDLSILEGVLGLGLAFRREIIAEGVESNEHGDLLLQLGCDIAQGFCIGMPMPASEFPKWISKWRPILSWGKQAFFSHVNLPLLFAGIEHRALVLSIEKYINGNQKSTIQMANHHCRFGVWLDAESHVGYDEQQVFQDLKLSHLQLHELGDELCRLSGQGRNQEAAVKLGELHSQLETVLGQLKALIH